MEETHEKTSMEAQSESMRRGFYPIGEISLIVKLLSSEHAQTPDKSYRRR